jgi:hypothetical protein
MRTRIRTGIVAAVGALLLAFAGSASAAIAPKFIVVAPPHVGQGAVSITADLNQNDDAVAKVTMYVPLGYQLNAPNVGQKVGDVTARARAADLGNAILPLTGTIMAVDPASVAAQSAQCDDVVHAATWVMNLTAAGQTLQIPMFIDATTGAEAALAVYKIVVCLPPPDLPAGTPGRATFGAKLVFAQFDVNALANPPATGDYRWRSLWTPYTPGTGTPNAAATVEAQSLVRLPSQVTLRAKKVKVHKKGKVRTLVALSGRLSRNFVGAPGVRVSLQDGKSKKTLYRLKAVFTKKDGSFVKKLYVAKKSWFMAEVQTPLQALGAAGCQASFGPAVKCVSAFVGPQHILSQVVRVTPYRR